MNFGKDIYCISNMFSMLTFCCMLTKHSISQLLLKLINSFSISKLQTFSLSLLLELIAVVRVFAWVCGMIQ
jgi:hypothetical protein